MQALVSEHELSHQTRAYLRICSRKHGHQRTAGALGVSRYTLWRFLSKRQGRRILPSAVLDQIGGSVETLEAATRELLPEAPPSEGSVLPDTLPDGLHEALLLVCGTPFATVGQQSLLGRVPLSTLRGRLQREADARRLGDAS